jgi:hypothetical protein
MGKEEWMFFNPTSGTYQRRKVKKERIRQVRTNSPMKILFLGVGSTVTPKSYCGMRNEYIK